MGKFTGTLNSRRYNGHSWSDYGVFRFLKYCRIGNLSKHFYTRTCRWYKGRYTDRMWNSEVPMREREITLMKWRKK